MRICFLGDARNVHLARAASGLSDRGHEVRVVCHKPRLIPGVAVERFEVPGPALTNPFRWTTRWERYLRGFFRSHDVVILFFLHDWGLTEEIVDAGTLVAFPQGSDIVLPEDTEPPEEGLVAKRRALLRSAHVVATTGPKFAREVARFADLSEKEVRRLPFGVDLAQFPGRGHRPRTAEEGARVGFFKGFHHVYGPQYLIRAIPRILADLPATRFELVGDGPLLEPCKALAEELDIALSIRWTSRQSHRSVPTILAGWDLSVIPSLCESFGVAALESSAMELPIVASKVGGMPDTVDDGETGLLIEPRCPEALADAILTLLADRPRRERMGEQGRTWVREHYEWTRVLNQWEETLGEACERRTGMQNRRRRRTVEVGR